MIADPWMTPVAGLGLPVQPVVAPKTIASGAFAPPGPSNGPSYRYDAFLAPGTYEQAVVPDPGYDAVFGPAVNAADSLVPAQVPSMNDIISVTEFESTVVQTGSPALPKFIVSRADGLPLDGWTAYLRDTTGRTVSNVPTLSGTTASFQLLTIRGLTDALNNAVLVLQPKPDAPSPTAVFPNVGNQVLPTTEPYPALPPPVSVTGNILGPSSLPIDADLEFEGLAFSNGASLSFLDFEFTTTASARISQNGSGSAFRGDPPAG